MVGAKDRNGTDVVLGARIRIVSLSGGWLDDLAPLESERVLSMVGEEFEIEEFDEYGYPWVTKEWRTGAQRYHSHLAALDAAEMEVVADKARRR